MTKVCKNGHPFTYENTYWLTNKKGTEIKVCKECRRQAWHRFAKKVNDIRDGKNGKVDGAVR